MASNSAGLGRPPADLADVLALTAVAGPAVTALRALARVSGGLQRVTDTSLRNHAGHVAEGFRSLFNQPEVMVMLRRVNNAEPYWQRVLEYGARGGLQAVLDEYAHVLAEHLGVSGRPPAQIEQAVGTAMCEALTLRTATVTADSVDATGELAARVEKMGFRTRFAVRYGGRSREDTQTVLRQGDVQKAFNSPFWPFVLCSTSVGQEGLDFHLYCHALMHWNLPSNPVDLEQREGRIHRYKGHAVRKNVALAFSAGAGYAASGVESDSWHQLFESARSARGGETSDLEPFWVYTTEGGAHIERHLPMIPLSKDVERANGLRRSLAVYRMAFGQSRQGRPRAVSEALSHTGADHGFVRGTTHRPHSDVIAAQGQIRRASGARRPRSGRHRRRCRTLERWLGRPPRSIGYLCHSETRGQGCVCGRAQAVHRRLRGTSRRLINLEDRHGKPVYRRGPDDPEALGRDQGATRGV